MTEKHERITTCGTLVVISGRSGSGKDTIFQRVLEHDQIKSLGFKQVVTHATRKMRTGEVHGKDYHFTDEETLFKMHENNELVEQPTPQEQPTKQLLRRN